MARTQNEIGEIRTVGEIATIVAELGSEQNIENFLYNPDVIIHVSTLNFQRIDWLQLDMACKRQGCKSSVSTKFKGAVVDQKRVNRGAAEDALDGMMGEYFVADGRIYYTQPDGDTKRVCDFTAQIVEVIHNEHGGKDYVIEGEVIDGHKFSVKVGAEEFDTGGKLRAVLSGAAGARGAVRHRMGDHLPPAVKDLSLEYKSTKIFHRTGWKGNTFIIPGREPEGTIIELDETVNYNVVEGDIDEGLEVLANLLSSIGYNHTVPAYAAMLYPQISRFVTKAGRFSTFIVGQNGSLKTAWTLTAIRTFMHEFNVDNGYTKWTNGPTVNALVEVAVQANAMPMIFDNYRSKDYLNAEKLRSLIHATVEGGTKKRLSRSARLIAGKTINAFTFHTGEDFNTNDPAADARTVVIEFPKWGSTDLESSNKRNVDLDFADDNAEQLSAVGWAWIEWLESEEGQKIVMEHGDKFKELQSHWSGIVLALSGANTNINVMRIAHNLACLNIVFECMKSHPDIKTIIDEELEAGFMLGLSEIADNAVKNTTHSDEGEKFIFYLRDLVAGGRAYIARQGVPMSELIPDDRNRAIGWDIEDRNAIAIVSSLARSVIARLTGDKLEGMSQQRVNKKLDQIGALVKPDGAGLQHRISVKGKKIWVIMIRKEFLGMEEIKDDNGINDIPL